MSSLAVLAAVARDATSSANVLAMVAATCSVTLLLLLSFIRHFYGETITNLLLQVRGMGYCKRVDGGKTVRRFALLLAMRQNSLTPMTGVAGAYDIFFSASFKN